MAINITVTTGGVTTVLTVPEKQNTISLSKTQITQEERTKLAGIEDGAQVNQTIQTRDGLAGASSPTSGNVALSVDSTVVRTSGDQSISGEKTFTNLSINGEYKFPTLVGTPTQVLKVNSAGDSLEFGDASVVAGINDLTDVNVDFSTANLEPTTINGGQQVSPLTNRALVWDPVDGQIKLLEDAGGNYVLSGSQVSPPPQQQFVNEIISSIEGGAVPGLYANDNGVLSVNQAGPISNALNFYVNGASRFDGSIQVNDPTSTGYSLPTTDGTANQLLATDGSGSVTFVTPSTSNVTEGTNLYYTDARVAANSAVVANTAKVSYPSADAAKVAFISVTQAVDLDTMESDIAANTLKVGYTDAAVDSRIAAASIDDLSDVDTSTVAPTDGQALIWDNTAGKWEPGSAGSASPWTTSGSDIYYTTGNVGVGTTTPAQPLHVNGTIRTAGSGYTTDIVTHSNGGVTIGEDISGVKSQAVNIGRSVGRFNAGTRGIFIGIQAGYRGSYSHDQISLGQNSNSGGSAYSKTSAIGIGSYSNYNGSNYTVSVGANTGSSSPSSYTNSAFFGHQAGNSGGSNSVFVGYQAGKSNGAQTVDNTVAVGYQALTALTTGAGNTAVGYQAGDALTTGNNNTILGYQAGNVNSWSNNTLIGYNTGASLGTNRSNNTIIGYNADVGTTTYNATAIGEGAEANGAYTVSIGSLCTNGGGGDWSAHVGFNIMRNASGTRNAVMGGRTMYTTGGSYNVVMGSDAFDGGGSGNDNNVVLGYNAGHSGSGNVLIGRAAGSTGSLSNKLYIENSNSTTPLIYGEFDTDILRVNGTLQVNDPSSTGYAFPTATGTLGQVLEVDASGDLVFATPSGGGSGGLGTADQTLTGDRLIDTNGYNLAIELDPTGTADTFTIHDGTHDLFQVDTSTTGTLFSVNDVSGLPKLEVDEDEGVIAKSIKVDDGALTVAGQYGKGAEIWYQGTSTSTAGSVYYLDSSGNWANTDASAVATAKGMLSVSAGTDSDVDGMVIKGFVYVGTDPGGNVGDVVYLSETANQLTTTAPTTASAVVRVCGYKVGTNIVYFDPSKDWIELT